MITVDPTRYVDLEGVHHSSMSRMCAKYGINYSRFYQMVRTKGYSVEDALKIMTRRNS